MKYQFTLYGTLWSGDEGVWHCEKTAEQLKELGGGEDIDDPLLDICAKKLAADFDELIDYSVNTVEIKITPFKLMSDENFEKAADVESIN